MIKDYKTQDITIKWEVGKCIHAGECVKRLPNVYKPKEKPWIKAEKATTQELKDQINACPSGALSFISNENAKDGVDGDEVKITKAEVIKNGPLRIHGNILVVDAEGVETKRERITGFCRCGASANKPFCDGAHKSIGFEG